MIDVRETGNATATDVTNDSIYEKYQEEIHEAWGKKLVKEFYNQHNMYIAYKVGKLDCPIFRVDDTLKRWGQWSPKNRTISISLRLLRDYSWDAVVQTIKHEMAHMIVDEIYTKQGIDDNGKSHGELFKKACKVMGLEGSRVTTSEEKKNYKVPEKERIVSRVKKLMALGESPIKEEAETAIIKAHELMIRYNISNIETSDEDKVFVGRPVGHSMTKIPTYIKTLVRLIKDYYFVEAIYMTKTHEYARSRCSVKRYVEFYGEPHNVDIAEYVFHFLLMEAEREWNTFKKSDEYKENAKVRDYDYDHYTGKRIRVGRYSKIAFLDGVFHGFKGKLRERKCDILDQMEQENNMLPVCLDDPLLHEKYVNHYNPRSFGSSSGYGGSGFNKGQAVGKGITIRSGVTRGSGNSVKLLN